MSEPLEIGKVFECPCCHADIKINSLAYPELPLEPTEEMIEAGAKAAYARLFNEQGEWPDTNCSMDAKHFRYAAEACYLAMVRK